MSLAILNHKSPASGGFHLSNVKVVVDVMTVLT